MNLVPSLEALGLTRLEALVYAYLVGHPAATGYGVSKGIGKPTANVYRALESLERKGAVSDDRASPPLFRAVPPDELIEQIEREFMDRRAIAARALASLKAGPERDDDGFFALKSVDQVMGRARVMLAAVRQVILIDAAAERLAFLADALDDARSRGVRTVVLGRGALPPHPDIVPAPAAGASPAILRVVADAREALIATIAPGGDGARDAVWTRNPLFARTLHDAIANEAFFAHMERGLREGMSVDEMESAFEDCRALRALARV